MLPHGSNAPQRVERSRSDAILPMVSILSEERRRERASPMPLYRRRLGPSRGQHVAPYNVRLQSGTPRQGPYDGRSHGAPPRGYSPSSGGYAGSRTGPGMGRKATPHQAGDTLGPGRVRVWVGRLLPIKRRIRLWDKPASTPAIIAARAWAQASDDTPQSASKQHHRYTTWRAAHETVGFRQRCPFSGCRVQSSPTTSSSADMHPVVTHAAPSPFWCI